MIKNKYSSTQINDFVIEYRTASRRRKNDIFIILRSIYLPKFLSKAEHYKQKWHDYLFSEYDWQVLRAIDCWDKSKGVLFTTYLYIRATVKPFSTVKEKYIYKSNREPSLSNVDSRIIVHTR